MTYRWAKPANPTQGIGCQLDSGLNDLVITDEAPAAPHLVLAFRHRPVHERHARCELGMVQQDEVFFQMEETPAAPKR